MYTNDFCSQFQSWRQENSIPLIKVSKAINKPVSTINAWLLGYNPIPERMKDALEQFMKECGN